MPGSYAPNGNRYIPQLTTQGTTDYAQIVINETATDAWMQVRLMYGDTGYTTLSEAITTIGSTRTALEIPPSAEAIAVSVNTTIPSNIQLIVRKGGYFDIANGVTLTINGALDAGLYRIFTCTGTGKVEFGPGVVEKIYPAWWGLEGDGTTDDTASIQAAINAAGSAGGGEVILLPGDYKITSSLTIGDGGPDSWSTYDGVRLVGTAPAFNLNSGSPTKSPVNLSPHFASPQPSILIRGPIMGWGVKGLSIDCSNDSNSYGLQVTEGQGGCCEDLLITECSNISLLLTTNAGVTWYTNTGQNSFDRTFIYMNPNAASAIGILLTGNASGGNSCFNTFRKTHITPTNAGHIGVLFQYADSNSFYDLDVNPIDAGDPSNPVCIAMQFTYNIKTGFPNANQVIGFDPYQNTIIISSTPAAGAAPNYIFLSTSNAAQPQNLAGVTFKTVVADKARMYLNGAQNLDAGGAVVELDTTFYDTNNLCDTSSHTITVKINGYYRVSGQISVASYSGASTLTGGIGMTGDDISEGKVSNNGVEATLNASRLKWMNKDDYVYLYGSISGGSTAVTTGSINTYLELEGPL